MASFHKKSEYFKRLLFILDCLLLVLVYTTVLMFVEHFRTGTSIDTAGHLGVLPIIVVAFALSRWRLTQDLNFGRYTLSAQVSCLVKELAIAVVATLILIFLLKLQFFSRFFFGVFCISALGVLIAVRLFLIWWYFIRPRDSLENSLNVLIIGSGQRAHRMTAMLRKSFEWGLNVVGFLDPQGISAGRRKGDKILGHVDDISQVLKDHVVEEVIVAVPRSMIGDIQKIFDACQEEGVRLRFMVDFYDFKSARIQLSMVQDIPLVSFEPVARNDLALIAKRMFDIVVTLATMPVILPLFAIVAIAVRLDSKGPAFFTQDRVGLHKRQFKMIKFRSMVVDAEERMKEIEHLNEAEGANFKISDDPRVTRVGKFIRKTSIDELPQLFNVLKGDMSLVGPRPMSLRDVALFDKGVQRRRFSVRPGITGLWQVSGRSNLSFDRWIELDLDYIEHWSFGLDMKILFLTVPAVLRGSGAV